MNDNYCIPNEDEIDDILKKHSKEAEEIVKDPHKLKEFLNKVLDKLNKVLDKLQNIPVIGTMIEDIRLLVCMIQDYANGNYKEVPLSSIIIAVAALVYFLSPIDLIPDAIPIVGYLDDAAVVGFALTTIHNDIQSYRQWAESIEQDE